MIIESKITEFLTENFVFKRFEIDEWLNKRIVVRYQYRNRHNHIDNHLEIDYLASFQLEEWKVVNKTALNYFFEEYCWFLMGKYSINKGVRSQKKLLKNSILSIIENNLAELITFDKGIKPFFDKARVKVKRIKPLPIDKRSRVNIHPRQTCYICRNSSLPHIADPAFVYDVYHDSNEPMYRIMYFTNFGDYLVTTNKIDINGYGFASVYSNEIGLTPEEAVKNRY